MIFKLIEDLGNTFVYAVGFETEVNIDIHEDEEPDIDIKDSYEYDALVEDGIESILDSIKKTLYNNKDEICSKLGITHFSIVDSDIDYGYNIFIYPYIVIDKELDTDLIKTVLSEYAKGHEVITESQFVDYDKYDKETRIDFEFDMHTTGNVINIERVD